MPAKRDPSRSVAESDRGSAVFLRALCRNATESSPLPLIAAEGPEHVIRYVNPAFCRLSGLTADEVVGHPLAEIVSERKSNPCGDMLDRVYLTGNTEALSNQAHTGPSSISESYWSYTAWAVPELGGHPRGVMLQVIDTTDTVARQTRSLGVSEAITVSAIRQLENTERAEAGEGRSKQALRESEHRMKDQLQSVCALLDIHTMANEESVPVAELVQIRGSLRTMALIHDLLTRDIAPGEQGALIAVEQILEQLLPMLQLLVGAPPIEWTADDMAIPIQQAVSLAVIVNELVTNAIKHGGNRIELEAIRPGYDAHLVVRDNGPGFPAGFDPRAHCHYGLELLDTMVRAELRGEIAFTNRPEGGACVEITFPLPHAGDSQQ
jgi:PAS domain S-box-containing protein